jgi:hypothetical protein
MNQDRNKGLRDEADVASIVANLVKIGKNKLAGLSAGAYDPKQSMENFFLFLMWSSCFTLAVTLSLALLSLMGDHGTSRII